MNSRALVNLDWEILALEGSRLGGMKRETGKEASGGFDDRGTWRETEGRKGR